MMPFFFFYIKQSLRIFTFSPVLPLLELSTLNGTKTLHTCPYWTFFELIFSPSVLKSVSIGKNISLYTEALLLKLWHVHFSFYCYVQYMWCICVATSEDAIQPRWIPFSLFMNEIELCTLMYLFTFVFYFSLLVFHGELDAR